MSKESGTVWIVEVEGKPVEVFWDEDKALAAQREIYLLLQQDYALRHIKPTLEEYDVL